MDSDSDSAASEPVRLEEDREWEDAEDDTEEVTFVSLFDDRTFANIKDMFTYCKTQFEFDVWKLQETLGLDDLEQIKLINYIRSEAKTGNTRLEISDKSAFEDDKYLRPVLEDDAVLYSLEDAFSVNLGDSQANVRDEVESLRQQLVSLQIQFQNYREDVQRTLAQQLASADNGPLNSSGPEKASGKPKHIDDDYFQSYSYNSIHHLMLSDKVRTDAYRDFIYDNKDLFAGKTVLDVGCGTGILSMFCAKAGAKQVIAVDNSDIISKARENIRLNKLDDRILCLKGKIEEVTLPVEQVDVIVSEWMGYCLLYESMLDSVIYARDKYLVKDGLMVPSHATLRIAPLADSELKANHIDFWKDVYGFDMTPMLEKAHEEAIARSVDPKELATGPTAADACTFKTFDLHTVTVDDESFADKFSFTWKAGFQNLEGFVIWFDIFFARDGSPRGEISIDTVQKHGLVALPTGPFTEQTHWQQGVLLIDDRTEEIKKGDHVDLARRYKEGDKLEGIVTYSRTFKDSRSLQIVIELHDAKAATAVLTQKWKVE